MNMDKDDFETPVGQDQKSAAGLSAAQKGPDPGGLSAQDVPPQDIDLANVSPEEDEEARLPEPLEDDVELVGEGRLATG
ncbi:MAG: hypothetical protein K2X60_08680, partial [Xanthobacteraceae bacterium]|nr:hypothetical protein [Xanthobacteraceae bacterium]